MSDQKTDTVWVFRKKDPSSGKFLPQEKFFHEGSCPIFGTKNFPDSSWEEVGRNLLGKSFEAAICCAGGKLEDPTVFIPKDRPGESRFFHLGYCDKINARMGKEPLSQALADGRSCARCCAVTFQRYLSPLIEDLRVKGLPDPKEVLEIEDQEEKIDDPKRDSGRVREDKADTSKREERPKREEKKVDPLEEERNKKKRQQEIDLEELNFQLQVAKIRKSIDEFNNPKTEGSKEERTGKEKDMKKDETKKETVDKREDWEKELDKNKRQRKERLDALKDEEESEKIKKSIEDLRNPAKKEEKSKEEKKEPKNDRLDPETEKIIVQEFLQGQKDDKALMFTMVSEAAGAIKSALNSEQSKQRKAKANDFFEKGFNFLAGEAKEVWDKNKQEKEDQKSKKGFRAWLKDIFG